MALGFYGKVASTCLLPTARCLLPTAHCPLPTAHCPLSIPTTHHLLPTAYCFNGKAASAYSEDIGRRRPALFLCLLVHLTWGLTAFGTLHP